MIVSCKIYLFGIFYLVQTQFDQYEQLPNDRAWKQYYCKTWMRPWCRYLCRYKLIKK